MVRSLLALALGVMFAVPARAADAPPAGTWKFSLNQLTFLILLSESDKGWVGDILGVTPNLRTEPAISKVLVKDDNISFDIKIAPGTTLSFDGRLERDGKKIKGTLLAGPNTIFINAIPSKLKNLDDKYAIAKEALQQGEGQEYFDAAINVLTQAAAKKMKPDDARAVADAAMQRAEAYGLRFQRTMALRIASTLADQEGFTPIAIEQARQAERMLRPEDDATVQMQVLESLAAVLRKAKKPDELKAIEVRIAKLEARDYAEYAKKNPPFKVEEFKGRKGKSDRVVLVEQFVDVNDQASAVAEQAADGVQQAYKPTDAVLIQYHLPEDGVDPLMNRDDIERAQAYKISALPLVAFSGKKEELGRAKPVAPRALYQSFCESIDETLEKPAGARIKLAATQNGDEINIKANVSELTNPGEKTMLRFALTEDRVRYAGGNGVRYHHNVLRAMPGGAKGVALTKKDSENSATVDVARLRKDLKRFLEDFTMGGIANPPLALNNLRVLAFIQDDTTGEVIQAAQVEIEEKKGE